MIADRRDLTSVDPHRCSRIYYHFLTTRPYANLSRGRLSKAVRGDRKRRNRPGLLGWVGSTGLRKGRPMSSLATVEHLRRASSQLPVSWYCDPATFEAEQRLLFARAPGYAGHELMVPNAGDFCALATRDSAQALVRNSDGIELVSNI